jgi:hypothetical protein
MCSAHLNMGTISGTTHIKTIFSFSSGTGNYSSGNAFSSSEDSVKQLIHILHKQSLLQTLRKNPDESNLENEGTNCSYPKIRKDNLCSKHMNMMAEVRWCTI